MPDVDLKEELHSNTRRTRITFRGFVGDDEVAIKCYRKPLFGLIHWLRAVHRGNKIRKAGGPVPPIIYAGWVPSMRCFGFATSFLTGFRSLRDALNAEASRPNQMLMIESLGRSLADIHQRGIEQPDGNLTNFMVNSNGRLAMVDEDDIRVSNACLSAERAASNLGNIAARLPDQSMREQLLSAYRKEATGTALPDFADESFWAGVAKWRSQLEGKRARRNIAPRQFD